MLFLNFSQVVTLNKKCLNLKKIIIRGEPDEPAVLCSSSSTYELKDVETSNSLLITPNILFFEDFEHPDKVTEKDVLPKDVTEVFHNYYELRPCTPRLKKLTDLMKKSLYRGKEYEDESIRKYTFDDLLNYIQASKGEINSALFRMHACEIHGYTRILDFEYKFEVFCRIIDVLDSESISVYKIPKEHVISLLEDVVPRQILEQMFVWYTSKVILHNEDNHDFYALKENEVCQIYGEVILRPMTMWWLRCVLESCDVKSEVELNFLHPAGSSRSFSYPHKSDILWLPFSDILTKIDPNCPTGRFCTLSEVESEAATARLRFRLQDFFDAWQKSVPEGMTTTLSQLKGLALCDMDANPQVISYFSSLDLPDNINERLEKLFKKRKSWIYEDIEPYLRDVTFSKNNAKTLLVKHSRMYRLSNGVAMFCSRW